MQRPCPDSVLSLFPSASGLLTPSVNMVPYCSAPLMDHFLFTYSCLLPPLPPVLFAQQEIRDFSSFALYYHRKKVGLLSGSQFSAVILLDIHWQERSNTSQANVGLDRAFLVGACRYTAVLRVHLFICTRRMVTILTQQSLSLVQPWFLLPN